MQQGQLDTTPRFGDTQFALKYNAKKAEPDSKGA
jgi:hypothetical protein